MQNDLNNRVLTQQLLVVLTFELSVSLLMDSFLYSYCKERNFIVNRAQQLDLNNTSMWFPKDDKVFNYVQLECNHNYIIMIIIIFKMSAEKTWEAIVYS